MSFAVQLFFVGAALHCCEIKIANNGAHVFFPTFLERLKKIIIYILDRIYSHIHR